MKTGNSLDLNEFFHEVQNEIYAIIRLSDSFPKYDKGNDIDIFCYDKRSFSQRILAIGNKYIKKGYKIKIDSTTKTHTYIDFYLDKNLEFRFDLYSAIPEYKKVRVKDCYFNSVIEHAKPKEMKWSGKKYKIYLPNKTDDSILRYLEYLEWIDERPEKAKHLEYVNENLKKNNERIGFKYKLNQYVSYPKSKYGDWKSKIRVLPLFIAVYKRTRINLGRARRRFGV